MAIGYVVAIVVEGKPVIFWREDSSIPCGEWTKNAQQARRSYSRESVLRDYAEAGNSPLVPCLTVCVVEERVVMSVMTEIVFERRNKHKHKTTDAD